MDAVSDLVSKELIQILNAIGLPILTYAIIILYRTLLKRTSFLEDSMKDMKNVYDSVLETAKKRSTELEASIENQKKFNELYLKMVSDSSEHADKINEWRKSEVILLEQRVEKLTKELATAREVMVKLKEENNLLKNDMERLKKEVDKLNRNMGPGEAMATSSK